MKALSLWQPWASLIAIGAKQIETRSWRPPATLDHLVICAAKRPVQLKKDLAGDFDSAYRISQALELAEEPLDLPLGVALCVVRVRAFHATDVIRTVVGADERAFGNYADGRYGWHLTGLRRFAHTFRVVGRQGLFDVDDALVAQALAHD